MAFCKHCGSKLEDGAKFCPKCGKPTNGEVDAPKSDGNDKNNEDAKNTKVGCISLIVIILFIGFIVNKCSGGEDSKATYDANAPKTEQVVTDTPSAEEQARKQQEEAERKAKEEAERQAQEKKAKKEEILRHGYEYGKKYGASLQKRDAINKERWCKERFLDKCEAPRTPEEMELYREFKEQFYKGWEDALF